MVNEAFSILSDEERTTKLKTVLKNRSGGYITEEEIKAIMAFVSLQKQYVIRIYNEPNEFRKSLVLADPGDSVVGMRMGCISYREVNG